MMNEEYEVICQRVVVAYLNILSEYLSEWTWGNMQNNLRQVVEG